MIAAVLLTSAAVSLSPGVRVLTNACTGGSCTEGMLCPISPDLAYTAAHVVEGASVFQWQDDRGGWHLLELLDRPKTEKDKDGNRVLVDGPVRVRTFDPFPHWYVLGKEPKVGERLFWQGRGLYAEGWYADEGLYFGRDENSHMAFGRGGHPGMSGGCVFNEKLEAVGVRLGTVLNRELMTHGVPSWSYGAPIWRR